MTEILVLEDGTELYGYAEHQNGKLYLYAHGKTLAELRSLLEDPEKTGVITSRRNDGTHTYEGYTDPEEILEISERFITATMKKPQ